MDRIVRRGSGRRQVVLGLVVAVARGRPAWASPQAPASHGPAPSRQIVPFLQTSFLAASNQPGVIFEADAFPHLVVWQNFDDMLDLRMTDRGQGWREYWAVSLTPGIRLKMFDGFSDPVNTPSYMPRIDVQHLWSTNYRSTVADLASHRQASVDLWEVHTAIEHHSNGQAGCLFLTQQPMGDDCGRPLNRPPTPADVNRKDGSFSTNDLRWGVNVRRTRLSASSTATHDVSTTPSTASTPR